MRLAVLASGGGTTLQAVLDAVAAGTIRGAVTVVIGNNSGARALERARAADVPALHLSTATHGDGLDAAIAAALRAHGADYVLLAGYMRKLGPQVLAEFAGRILNTHPALLPKFGGRGMFGRHVHEAVIAAREKESGATVHLVDAEYDTGRIVAQQTVPVSPGDTAETLERRVQRAEKELLIDVLSRLADGELRLGSAAPDRDGGGARRR
jgi:phosphoribosylglycinamide formyltransferase 1